MDNVPMIPALVGLIVLLIPLYFLPAILGRNKRNAGAIVALNVLAGWTFLGWIIALVWALSTEEQPTQVIVQQSGPFSAPLLCSVCGNYSAHDAKLCMLCGRALAGSATP